MVLTQRRAADRAQVDRFVFIQIITSVIDALAAIRSLAGLSRITLSRMTASFSGVYNSRILRISEVTLHK